MLEQEMTIWLGSLNDTALSLSETNNSNKLKSTSTPQTADDI